MISSVISLTRSIIFAVPVILSKVNVPIPGLVLFKIVAKKAKSAVELGGREPNDKYTYKRR